MKQPSKAARAHVSAVIAAQPEAAALVRKGNAGGFNQLKKMLAQQFDEAVREQKGGNLRFAAIGPTVMLGAEFICRARSKTMGKRIANALNVYEPNREGV